MINKNIVTKETSALVEIISLLLMKYTELMISANSDYLLLMTFTEDIVDKI